MHSCPDAEIRSGLQWLRYALDRVELIRSIIAARVVDLPERPGAPVTRIRAAPLFTNPIDHRRQTERCLFLLGRNSSQYLIQQRCSEDLGSNRPKQEHAALGLPPVIDRICEERRGLILVTGATGSGKSTTLAAMIDRINSTRSGHIVTIEDPIEFLHRDKNAFVTQREVDVDTRSFAEALRGALRQDPDVILVGEMRDFETIETALTAAETGHLVLSTLHTLDATETITRFVSSFLRINRNPCAFNWPAF